MIKKEEKFMGELTVKLGQLIKVENKEKKKD